MLQPPVYDTIAAAQLTLKDHSTFRTLADSGLKTLVRELLGAEFPSFEEVTAGRFFDELDPAGPAVNCSVNCRSQSFTRENRADACSLATRYACADADYTLRLYHLFNEWFNRYLPKHRYIVEQVESPTAVYVGLMKYNGLLADAVQMEQKRLEAEAKLESLRAEIAFIIGDVNMRYAASRST